MPSTAPRRTPATPTLTRMLARGATLRCPRCGAWRNFRRGWFQRYERCRTCGIRWRREVGFELGAVTINTILTFLAVAIGMVIGFVATVPDVAVVPMLVTLGAIALVMPIAIYPFTYTLWLAVDLAMHPPEPREVAEAAHAVDRAASVPGA